MEGFRVKAYSTRGGEPLELSTALELDEIVAGKWLHIEAMDNLSVWCAFIGPDGERFSMNVLLNNDGYVHKVVIQDKDIEVVE